MKTWQKVGIGVGAIVILGSISWYSIYQSNKGVVTVQRGKVVKQDLVSIVTASGEVRPKNYTNVLGEGIGKITDIVVKEGDQERGGETLFTLEKLNRQAVLQATE